MRRLTTTFVLMMTCLCLFPQRADAYFWEWLDSLSGPKFKGFTVQWRAICFTDDRLKHLVTALEIEEARAKLALEERTTEPERNTARQTIERNGRPDGERATLAFLLLNRLDAASKASQLARLGSNATTAQSDVMTKRVAAAIAWQITADAYAAAALQLEQKRGDESKQSENTATARKGDAAKAESVADSQAAAVGGGGFGVIVSACPANTIDRRRGSFDLNIAWGTDTKNDHNKMVMVGPSFSLRAYEWLDVGVAGGVAWFSSDQYRGFTKFYVEPAIVDFRPLAFGKHAKSDPNPPGWRYVPVLRYTMLTFPGGFARNSFGNGEAYGAEIVHQLGLHIDLEPLFHGAGRLR